MGFDGGNNDPGTNGAIASEFPIGIQKHVGQFLGVHHLVHAVVGGGTTIVTPESGGADHQFGGATDLVGEAGDGGEDVPVDVLGNIDEPVVAGGDLGFILVQEH